MHDTSPSVERLYRQKLMERSPEERFVMGARMFETARTMALASLPRNLSFAERNFNIFLRFYGYELDQETKNQVKKRLVELKNR